MSTLVQDLRYAARALARNRAFTLIALVALALGIGANTAIFTAVNAILFRPLPYEDPQRLVMLSTVLRPQGARIRTSALDLADWQAQNRSFSHMAGFIGTGFTLTRPCPQGQGGCAPEFFLGQLTSPSLFPLLGVKPMLGRALLPGEDAPGSPPVAVLSYALWRRLFAADPRVIGTVITLNGKPHTVVGVMPPRFEFPASRYELWVPLDLSTMEGFNNRSNHSLQVIARRRPGVSLAAADADMRALAARLARQYPETNENLSAAVVPLTESVLGEVRPALLVLLGACTRSGWTAACWRSRWRRPC
jgi:putative ABC transport system permease protein